MQKTGKKIHFSKLTIEKKHISSNRTLNLEKNAFGLI